MQSDTHLTVLIPHNNLAGLSYCCAHFTDEEPETQKREGTCPITGQLRQDLKTRSSEAKSSPLPPLPMEGKKVLRLRGASKGSESPVIRGRGAEAAGPPAKSNLWAPLTPQGQEQTSVLPNLTHHHHGGLFTPSPPNTLSPECTPPQSRPPSHHWALLLHAPLTCLCHFLPENASEASP